MVTENDSIEIVTEEGVLNAEMQPAKSTDHNEQTRSELTERSEEARAIHINMIKDADHVEAKEGDGRLTLNGILENEIISKTATLYEENQTAVAEANEANEKTISIKLVNTQSPSKVETHQDSKLPFLVPSPFKNILFWPETPNIKKKKVLFKIPSVASSEQWKAYYNNKKNEKEKKEVEKQTRKRLREEKSNEKNTKKKTKKAKDNSEGKNDTKTNLIDKENSNDSQTTSLETSVINDRNFIIPGNYVIVNYIDMKFPGVIEEVNNNGEALVNAMTSSGINWKWPPKKDVLWYQPEDILEKIEEPVLINNNKRGIFAVPEIKKYM